MKKLISLSLIIVLLASFSFQDTWFVQDTPKYKIAFPKKPQEQTIPVQTALGELKTHLFSCEPSVGGSEENYAYIMAVTDYPESSVSSDKKDMIDKFFRGSIDGSVKNVNGKLLSETSIELNGYPGREIKIDIQNGQAVITMRDYLIKNRMYMLQVINDGKKGHDAALGKFFSSFSLKP